MDPWLLWSRALVLGLLASGLGAAGHVLADGLLPSAGAVATLMVVMVALSALLLLRPASGARLASGLAGGQAAVHLVLTAAAGHGPATAAHGDPSGHGGHGGHLSMPGPTPEPSGLPVDHVLAHVAGHAPMMAAHLAVAALLGCWLARGESALWTLIALAARRLVGAVPALAVMDARPRMLTTLAPGPLGPASPWQSRPRTQRGPPVAAMS